MPNLARYKWLFQSPTNNLSVIPSEAEEFINGYWLYIIFKLIKIIAIIDLPNFRE
jgi:hypothetical protein